MCVFVVFEKLACVLAPLADALAFVAEHDLIFQDIVFTDIEQVAFAEMPSP